MNKTEQQGNLREELHQSYIKTRQTYEKATQAYFDALEAYREAEMAYCAETRMDYTCKEVT